MARSHVPQLFLFGLLTGGAAACAGGPTSDFPYQRPPALNGGSTGSYSMDAGSDALDAGAGGSTGGTTGGSADTTGTPLGAVGDGGVQPAFDGGKESAGDAGDASCVDAAGDAGGSMQTGVNDGAPDPCEGAEGGTSAGG